MSTARLLRLLHKLLVQRRVFPVGGDELGVEAAFYDSAGAQARFEKLERSHHFSVRAYIPSITP